MITQFGINMLVPIFLCTFAGIYLDRRLDTSYLAVALFFVGALAGFTNVFRFAKKIYEQPAVTRRRRTDLHTSKTTDSLSGSAEQMKQTDEQ